MRGQRRFPVEHPACDIARHRLAYYRNGYHLLLRDLEGAAEAGDVAGWVFDRKAPLPSHADRREAVRPWPPGKDGGS